jgi:hypothetical protein
MISFVKYVAVLLVGFIAAAVLPGNADEDGPAKTEAKTAGGKKDKKPKSPKTDQNAPPKKGIDVPVVKGHDSLGMRIPYFGTDGVKREMNFSIGVASRLDENHIQMKDLQIQTFDDNGQPEMSIDLPTSVLDTDTSVITSQQHVTIRRADFELTGEAMVFNTKTKQGGLGGNVRMLIYNLENETSDPSNTPESKEK